MHARVVGQLRVERRDQEAPLPQQHGHAVVAGEHLDVGAGVRHPRRADEHAAQRLAVVAQVEVGLEARELAAVAVALHIDVDQPEVGAVEQDHPRARAEDGRGELPDRLLEPVEPHQARDRRRLAAGDHEPVEALELLGQAHLDHVRAEPAQHRRVLAEVALDCEDTDSHRCHSRVLPPANRARGSCSVGCRSSRPSRTIDDAECHVDERRLPELEPAVVHLDREHRASPRRRHFPRRRSVW